jgi:hypothetical protein
LRTWPGFIARPGQYQRPLIIAVGLCGAALIYGDVAITPAISVLSAIEGLKGKLRSEARQILPPVDPRRTLAAPAFDPELPVRSSNCQPQS